MLVMTLPAPFVMIFFGRSFMRKAPDNIDRFFGYRTAMSMKNRDTRTFAHKYFGKLWFVLGLALLPVSVLPMIFVMGKSMDTVGTVGMLIVFTELIPLLGPIFPTEAALKRIFDSDGNRTEP